MKLIADNTRSVENARAGANHPDGRAILGFALRLAVMVAMMLILWASACVFMLMEPLP